MPGQLGGDLLGEQPALRRQQDDGSAWAASTNLRLDGFDGLEDRLRLEDHAGAASVGIVVHAAVSVMGAVTDVVDFDRNQSRLDGAAEDAADSGLTNTSGKMVRMSIRTRSF